MKTFYFIYQSEQNENIMYINHSFRKIKLQVGFVFYIGILSYFFDKVF